jgi:AcrR family transcriptional regulator
MTATADLTVAADRPSEPPAADRPWERQAEILAVAHSVLARDGAAALSVGRLAGELGITTAALRAQYPGREELLELLIEDGLEAQAAALARPGGGPPQSFQAYRRFALQNPELYRLVTERPLPPGRPAQELERRAAAAFVEVLGPDLACAAWAFAHGMVELELDRRLAPGADLEAAWRAGVQALERARPVRRQT